MFCPANEPKFKYLRLSYDGLEVFCRNNVEYTPPIKVFPANLKISPYSVIGVTGSRIFSRAPMLWWNFTAKLGMEDYLRLRALINEAEVDAQPILFDDCWEPYCEVGTASYVAVPGTTPNYRPAGLTTYFIRANVRLTRDADGRGGFTTQENNGRFAIVRLQPLMVLPAP